MGNLCSARTDLADRKEKPQCYRTPKQDVDTALLSQNRAGSVGADYKTTPLNDGAEVDRSNTGGNIFGGVLSGMAEFAEVAFNTVAKSVMEKNPFVKNQERGSASGLKKPTEGNGSQDAKSGAISSSAEVRKDKNCRQKISKDGNSSERTRDSVRNGNSKSKQIIEMKDAEQIDDDLAEEREKIAREFVESVLEKAALFIANLQKEMTEQKPVSFASSLEREEADAPLSKKRGVMFASPQISIESFSSSASSPGNIPEATESLPEESDESVISESSNSSNAEGVSGVENKPLMTTTLTGQSDFNESNSNELVNDTEETDNDSLQRVALSLTTKAVVEAIKIVKEHNLDLSGGLDSNQANHTGLSTSINSDIEDDEIGDDSDDMKHPHDARTISDPTSPSCPLPSSSKVPSYPTLFDVSPCTENELYPSVFGFNGKDTNKNNERFQMTTERAAQVHFRQEESKREVIALRQEYASIMIQAAIRGFLARQRLRKMKNVQSSRKTTMTGHDPN